MIEELAIKNEIKRYNKRFVAGCTSVAFILVIVIVAIANFSYTQARDSTRYPGAERISRHNNYSGLPNRLKWDDSFTSTDNFRDIYYWYSTRYEMGPESRANEACTYLESTEELLVTNRFTGVFICSSDKGNQIFVSQTIWVRDDQRRSNILNSLQLGR